MKEVDVPEMYKQGRTGINPPQESLTRLEDRMYEQHKVPERLHQSIDSYRNLLMRSGVPEIDVLRLCKEMENNVEGLNHLAEFGAIESFTPTDLT